MSFSENLDKLISSPTSSFARRTRPTYPNGWEPGVAYEENGSLTVTTDLVPKIDDEDSWKSAIESLGVSVPEGWVVRPYEVRYDPAAWHRDTEEGNAVTRPAWRYRFKIEQSKVSEIKYDDLIELVNKRKSKKQIKDEVEIGNKHWLLTTGDWQLGKVDGDGASGTIERILESTDKIGRAHV